MYLRVISACIYELNNTWFSEKYVGEIPITLFVCCTLTSEWRLLSPNISWRKVLSSEQLTWGCSWDGRAASSSYRPAEGKRKQGDQCGSGRCELLHAQQKTQVLYVCMNTYTPNTPRVRQKADAHVKTKHTKSCTSAFRKEYILTQTTALIIICGCSSFSLHADSITH